MVIFSSSFSWAKKIKESKTSADADQTENDIMTAQEINKRNHPWLSKYIQDLLRNEKNLGFQRNVIVAKQILLVIIQI